MTRFLFTLIFALVLPLSMTAQNIVQFTSDEGLSNSCVRRIYEDSRHNVWICTRNGLNRYDGSKMNIYHYDATDPNSLGNDIVTFILEADPDHILVACEGGLQSYSYATNKFTNVPMITENGDTLRAHIVSASQFLNGEIHICATSAGSYVLRKNDSGELYAAQTNEYIHKGRRPNFLLNTRKGEVFILDERGNVGLVEGKKTSTIEGAEGLRRICAGKDGTLYAVNSNKLLKYERTSRRFVAIESEDIPASTVIKSVRSDGKGHLLICTDGNGLKIYDEATGKVHQSMTKSLEFNIDSSNVEDAMMDSYGNLWIGVYWKGVFVFPKTQSAFGYIGYRSPLHNTIGGSSVTSILPTQQGAWVATDHNGLYRVNSDGTESRHWSPSASNGVPETINTILEDSRGTLWLGSFISGLMLMDPARGTFAPFSSICKDASKVNLVFNLHEDEQHCIWIATMGSGLFRYNPTDRTLRSYLGEFNDNDSGVPVPWVACVKTHGNRLYVGCSAGLYMFEIQPSGSLKHIALPSSLPTVYDIGIAPNGAAWIATVNGLYCISPEGEISSVSTADGLPDNHVCSIQFETGRNTMAVWAATDHGLCRIETENGYLPKTDGSSLNIRTYFVSDGLQGNEFCNGVSAQRDGIIYFGGINGINYFNASTIDHVNITRSLDFRIVNFYIFGEPAYAGDMSGGYEVMDKWVDEAEELHVCHSDNTFSLELASCNLLAKRDIYEYSINGREWINLGEGQNRISFTNMASGEYLVRIRVAGNDDEAQERRITIIVHPAWYASTLAYIIYIVLLFLIAYFIMQQVKERMAARRVLQRHRQEEELNEARIQFFMNISHEIRTPMTLILAPLEKLRSMDTDSEHQRNYKLIHQNAHRILRLINQMMDVRKIEKGQFKLDYSQTDIVDFVQNLYDVYETSAKNRNIDFQFDHAGLQRLNAMVDQSSFDKIVMNLLSNAFKFTPDEGHITIGLTTDDAGEMFTLTVTDSGVGIADEEKEKVFKRFYSSKHQNGYIGTGIGLNLTALLVDLHEGNICVKDNPDGQGTQFVVNLPLRHYAQTKGTNAAEVAESAESTAKPASLQHADVQDSVIEEGKGTTIRHRNLLVVEDDAAIRQYIHSELAADFTIHECSNGMEGWEYVQKNPNKVDLIVSDIMMPVMEGTTLCQKVKGNFTTSHIPVILMSAKTTEADRIAGMSIGADAYVTKPFNLELLRSTALNILKQRQMLRGKFSTEAKHEGKIDQIEIVSPDENLMGRVLKIINQNMDNPDLSVEFVADKVGVSRVHFHRKIKELTGQTPRDFIKSIRLKEAARLLSEKHLDITDVSIATGFKSLSTFSTSFKQVYGQTPTEYMKGKLGIGNE